MQNEIQRRFSGDNLEEPPRIPLVIENALRETNAKQRTWQLPLEVGARLSRTDEIKADLIVPITVLVSKCSDPGYWPDMIAAMGLTLLFDFNENDLVYTTNQKRYLAESIMDYTVQYCYDIYHLTPERYLEKRTQNTVVHQPPKRKHQSKPQCWYPNTDVAYGSGVKIPRKLIGFATESQAIRYVIETMICNIGIGTAKVNPPMMHSYRQACLKDGLKPLSRVEIFANNYFKHIDSWSGIYG